MKINETNTPTTYNPLRVLSHLAKITLIGALALPVLASAQKDLCKTELSSYCIGNLGIPRAQMPQLDEKTQNNYLTELLQNGTHIEFGTVPAHELTAVQKEMNYDTVMGIVDAHKKGKYNPCEDPILVATKNKTHSIVDGHHRAAACRYINGTQKASFIFEGIRTVLNQLKNYAGVFRLNLNHAQVTI